MKAAPARERVWSLAFELQQLEAALQAIVLVLDTIEPLAIEPRRVVETTAAATAVAHLLTARLRDVGRVLEGGLDPGALRSTHNATRAGKTSINRGEDVVFGAATPHAKSKAAR